MPRRIYIYADLPAWGWMNRLSTVGAFFTAAAALLIVWNLAASLFRGSFSERNSIVCEMPQVLRSFR